MAGRIRELAVMASQKNTVSMKDRRIIKFSLSIAGC
jgi:hypothetical protein